MVLEVKASSQWTINDPTATDYSQYQGVHRCVATGVRRVASAHAVILRGHGAPSATHLKSMLVLVPRLLMFACDAPCITVAVIAVREWSIFGSTIFRLAITGCLLTCNCSGFCSRALQLFPFLRRVVFLGGLPWQSMRHFWPSQSMEFLSQGRKQVSTIRHPSG